MDQKMSRILLAVLHNIKYALIHIIIIIIIMKIMVIICSIILDVVIYYENEKKVMYYDSHFYYLHYNIIITIQDDDKTRFITFLTERDSCRVIWWFCHNDSSFSSIHLKNGSASLILFSFFLLQFHFLLYYSIFYNNRSKKYMIYYRYICNNSVTLSWIVIIPF